MWNNTFHRVYFREVSLTFTDILSRTIVVITAHYHWQFIDSPCTVDVDERVSERANVERSYGETTRRRRNKDVVGGKMKEKRDFVGNCSVLGTMTFSTVYPGSAAISAFLTFRRSLLWGCFHLPQPLYQSPLNIDFLRGRVHLPSFTLAPCR